MKKMFFQFIFVYAFSLIVAILLLIFKSKFSEANYLVARILLFDYSIFTGMLLFIPRFTIWLVKKIFKNNVADPDKFPEGSISWPYIILFVFVLDIFLYIFFGVTLIIPIAVIIQSSYILYRFARIYKTLISENPE